jgi:hypothetical protein
MDLLSKNSDRSKMLMFGASKKIHLPSEAYQQDNPNGS